MGSPKGRKHINWRYNVPAFARAYMCARREFFGRDSNPEQTTLENIPWLRQHILETQGRDLYVYKNGKVDKLHKLHDRLDKAIRKPDEWPARNQFTKPYWEWACHYAMLDVPLPRPEIVKLCADIEAETAASPKEDFLILYVLKMQDPVTGKMCSKIGIAVEMAERWSGLLSQFGVYSPKVHSLKKLLAKHARKIENTIKRKHKDICLSPSTEAFWLDHRELEVEVMAMLKEQNIGFTIVSSIELIRPRAFLPKEEQPCT